jgi:hypothetical protein
MGDATNKLIYVGGFLNGGGPSYFSKLLVRKIKPWGEKWETNRLGHHSFMKHPCGKPNGGEHVLLANH